MGPYLNLAAFRARTLMPATYVDELEAAHPGWIDIQLDEESDAIDARLRKRYAAPFETPFPKKVLRWLTRIVTRSAWLKRGFDPNDPQGAEIVKDAETALEEIEEAADAENGLFDLPLRADTTKTGISKGGPLAYSEASPFVWQDEQGRRGRAEDSSGGGTYG